MATAHCPSADETFGEDAAVNSCIYDTKAERQLWKTLSKTKKLGLSIVLWKVCNNINNFVKYLFPTFVQLKLQVMKTPIVKEGDDCISKEGFPWLEHPN